jgi:hypothetical protein
MLPWEVRPHFHPLIESSTVVGMPIPPLFWPGGTCQGACLRCWHQSSMRLLLKGSITNEALFWGACFRGSLIWRLMGCIHWARCRKQHQGGKAQAVKAQAVKALRQRGVVASTAERGHGGLLRYKQEISIASSRSIPAHCVIKYGWCYDSSLNERRSNKNNSKLSKDFFTVTWSFKLF